MTPGGYGAQYIILSIALKDLLRGTLLTILNQLWYTWRRILKAGQRSIPFRRMPQSLWGDAEDENPGNWEELIETHLQFPPVPTSSNERLSEEPRADSR